MIPSRPTPDAIVSLTLRATSQGGRKWPLRRAVHRCPVRFGAENSEWFDCVFYVDEVDGDVAPGGPSVRVPVAFHFRDFVEDKLRPGATFVLHANVGEAVVLEVLPGDRR